MELIKHCLNHDWKDEDEQKLNAVQDNNFGDMLLTDVGPHVPWDQQVEQRIKYPAILNPLFRLVSMYISWDRRV